MTKQTTELFLKASQIGLMSTDGKLPEGASGHGRVVASDGKKTSIEFEDATIRVDHNEQLPYNTKVFFNAAGKMVSMIKPEVKPASTRGNTGAAKIPAVKTLY